jgi:hypothetical protein
MTATAAVAVVSSLVTFAVHQGGSGRFYAMLLLAFGLALPSTLLFQLLMRMAASASPTREAVAARVGYQASTFQVIKMCAIAGGVYAFVAFVGVAMLYWPADYTIVTSTPQLVTDAAISSLNNIKTALLANKEDDQWFHDSVSQAAVRNLDKSLQDAKAELASGNYRLDTVGAILRECDSLGDLGGGRRLFKPGCELGDFIQTIAYKGDVLPNIYNLQGQIRFLKPRFEALQNYVTLGAAIEHEWPNALLVSVMWATMAAVFAVSVLLYRRQELWEGLALKKLPDFVPNGQQERDDWLRTSLYDMAKLTPLEALRYPTMRARLADLVNAQPASASVSHLRTVA